MTKSRVLFSGAKTRADFLFRCGLWPRCSLRSAPMRSPIRPDAADASTDPRLQTVVVTATRSKQTAFDLPASIDSVSLQDPTANTPGINPSEYLQGVPGLIVRDRQNYAQDEQISIRGFGARSTFGVRGVRIYQDGIPATAPDGQGQVSAFSLDSGDRIEVLRGPFSALYGNSSGGVIQIFTADGQGPTEYRGTLSGGDYGTYRVAANARGGNDAIGYNVDFSHFYTDNYRAHARAERENGNAKITYNVGSDRQADLARQHHVVAERRRSARPHARAVQRESAPAAAGRRPVRYAQERASGTGRRDLRTGSVIDAKRARARLLRRTRRAAIPVDPDFDAAASDQPRRRDRSRRQLRRHRSALVVSRCARRTSVRTDRRHQLRPAAPASARLQQLRRQRARRAGRCCAATNRTTNRISISTCKANGISPIAGRSPPARATAKCASIRPIATSPRPTATTAAT